MRALTLLFSFLISLIFSMSCYSSQTSNENWMYEINASPHEWVQPESAVAKHTGQMITRMVPYFRQLKIDGPFHIELVESSERNRIALSGPEALLPNVIATVDDDTLFIRSTGKNKSDFNNVTIRIPAQNLKNISNMGAATIIGRAIQSNNLTIENDSYGRIFLNGKINLSKVTQLGSGDITVLNAYTPHLRIDASGDGNVNINGRVGVESIFHSGQGHVTVLGSDTDTLNIVASGRGTTTVVGKAMLKKVIATDHSHVYVHWVNGNGLTVKVSENAEVALAGNVASLSADLMDNAHFYGKYLSSGHVDVKTRNRSLANVSARNQIYASALDESTIYIFGSPHDIVRLPNNNERIISIPGTSPLFPFQPQNTANYEMPKQTKRQAALQPQPTVPPKTKPYYQAAVQQKYSTVERIYKGQCPTNSCFDLSWIILEGGYSWPISSENTTVEPMPGVNLPDYYISSALDNTWTAGIGFGKTFIVKSFSNRIGIFYDYLFPTTVTGQIDKWESVPTYQYEYKIRSNIFWIDDQLDLGCFYNVVVPFIELGIGAAWNTAYGYQETPFPEVPAQDIRDENAGFSSRTQVNFAYRLGLGVNIRLHKNLVIGALYRYQNLGDVRIGDSSSYPSVEPLTDTLKANQAILNIRYDMGV